MGRMSPHHRRSRPQGSAARAWLALAIAVCAAAGLGVLVFGGVPPAPAAVPVPAPDVADPGLIAPSGERASVLRVVDPVTFDARLDGRDVIRVRALGVQAPGECYAADGVAVAGRILTGVSVRLVPDPAGPPTDRFDRRLAHVQVDDAEYAVLAAEAGIVRTYAAGASEAAMPPIRDAEQRARTAGRGLWAPPCEGA